MCWLLSYERSVPNPMLPGGGVGALKAMFLFCYVASCRVLPMRGNGGGLTSGVRGGLALCLPTFANTCENR